MFLFISSQLTFIQGPSTDILETIPHDVALVDKETLLCQFREGATDKNEGQKHKFHTISRLPAALQTSSLVMMK